jgi:hypothetical protein
VTAVDLTAAGGVLPLVWLSRWKVSSETWRVRPRYKPVTFVIGPVRRRPNEASVDLSAVDGVPRLVWLWPWKAHLRMVVA